MAFDTFDLGRILQTASALKSAQQQSQTDAIRQKYLGLQEQQAQTQADQRQGIDQTLAANPNAQLSDLSKYGAPGIQAYTQLSQAQQQALREHNSQTYQISTQVANSDDPIATVKQLAPNFPIQYDQVHGAGAWEALTPQQIKAQAAIVSQHAMLGLVSPDKQWQASQQMALEHYKQSQANARQASANQARVSAAGGAAKAPAGYEPDPAKPGALRPIPGGPADKAAATQALGDPNASGDAYLASIPDKGLQALVTAIAQGREQVPRIYRSGNGGTIGPTQIAAAVSQYDPTFNAQDFNSRNRLRISATSGPLQKNMTALNQLGAHLGQLSDQVSGTFSTPVPLLNSALNTVEDPFTGKVTKYKSTADAVAHEVRAVFAGAGGGTLQELDSYLKTLRSNGSEEQKKAAIQNIADLVSSRIGILRNTYEQGMGKAGDPFQVVFPHAAQTLQTLSSLGEQGAANAPAAAQSGAKVLTYDPATGSFK